MTQPETWVVYSDGASRGNPGPASIGGVVIDLDGRVVHEVSETLGVTTNNVAEYKALVAVLEAALALGARRVEVRMDSELIVRQAIGRYRVKNPALIPLHNRVLALRTQFDEVVFRHVPRAQNKHADALANQALDRAP
ncbi:MAG: reverse transcriptase-like protein [Dehalococcoidia bacterium]|nr:reverse transcriptase-like protein [Dehalococcoidia bacterium]